MMTTRVAALLLLSAWLPVHAQTATRRCGAAQDLVVQALEHVDADSPRDTVRDANELLKRSEQMCSSLGDAWYYRSIFEAKLGNAAPARFSLQQARLLGSEAMEERLDPFVLAAPANPDHKPPATGGTRWALVIGIGKFQDTHIPSLRYSAADAQLFADTLESGTSGFAPDHVRILLNESATTREIKSSLNWIGRNAKPEDIVVVYIATHGSSRSLDSVGGVNYLITHDTDAGDQDDLFASALPMVDLVNTVSNRIHAQRTAIFIDTCYSGGAGRSAMGQTLSESTLQHIRQGEGRIIMTATRADQESMESEHLGHGYFTFYLAQALTGDPGKRPLSLIYAQVSREVSTHVAQDFIAYHLAQNPLLTRSASDTDFSLGTSNHTSEGTGSQHD